MPSERQKLFLEGPIGSALLQLAFPIILGNVLQTGYQLTDAFWVGRLGGPAVAAVAVSFPITFLVIALGAGLAIAGATLSAQYMGAGRQDMVNHVAHDVPRHRLWNGDARRLWHRIQHPAVYRHSGHGPVDGGVHVSQSKHWSRQYPTGLPCDSPGVGLGFHHPHSGRTGHLSLRARPGGIFCPARCRGYRLWRKLPPRDVLVIGVPLACSSASCRRSAPLEIYLSPW